MLIDNVACTGRWTLYNRKTKKTLVKWETYSFTCYPSDGKPKSRRSVRVKPLRWVTDSDTALPLDHLTAILTLKDELPP